MSRVLVALMAAVPLFAQQAVRYELSFPNAAHHEAKVRATFTGATQPVLEVVMSRASPGRYAVHDFAKNVYGFSAHDGAGKPLEVTRSTPYQWNIAARAGTVVVDYTLYGDYADGTYAGIDATHARLNMPATLAWAHGFEEAPVTIKIELPAGSNWKVATQHQANEDGSFTSPNLDRLMDGPIEIGPFFEENWRTGDARFRMALHHAGSAAESAAFAKVIARITAEEEGVFGAFPPYDYGQYTFLIDYLPYVKADGMEHRDSTSITGTQPLSGPLSQVGTVAHEFFHSWNVERIRPRSLEPFDFERANISGELWFAEGFTNYYQGLVLRRAGLWSANAFAADMARALTAVLTSPGRMLRSPAEMSRMAPFVDAATSIDATNFANTYISYYTYGQALGLGIDLAIRTQFPGRSLDDWMRAMWREHPDVQKPYTLADLERALASVTSAPFASNIFKRHILGTEPMDYVGLLTQVGFVLEPVTPAKAWLGARQVNFTATGVELNGAVVEGGPLHQAGLDRGDAIAEFDGKAVKSAQELEALLAAHKSGDRLHLVVMRRSGRAEVDVTLAAAPDLRMVAFEQAGRAVTPAVSQLREAWLASKAVHPAAPVFKYCHTDKRQFPFEYEKCPYDGSDLHLTPE